MYRIFVTRSLPGDALENIKDRFDVTVYPLIGP